MQGILDDSNERTVAPADDAHASKADRLLNVWLKEKANATGMPREIVEAGVTGGKERQKRHTKMPKGAGLPAERLAALPKR